MRYKYYKLFFCLILSSCAKNDGESSQEFYNGIYFLVSDPLINKSTFLPKEYAEIKLSFFNDSENTIADISFRDINNEPTFTQRLPHSVSNESTIPIMVGCDQKSQKVYPFISLQNFESNAWVEYYYDTNISDIYYTVGKRTGLNSTPNIEVSNILIPFVNFMQFDGLPDLSVEIRDIHYNNSILSYYYIFKNIGDSAAKVNRVEIWRYPLGQLLNEDVYSPTKSYFSEECVLPDEELSNLYKEGTDSLDRVAYIRIDSENVVTESDEENNLSNSFEW